MKSRGIFARSMSTLSLVITIPMFRINAHVPRRRLLPRQPERPHVNARNPYPFDGNEPRVRAERRRTHRRLAPIVPPTYATVNPHTPARSSYGTALHPARHTSHARRIIHHSERNNALHAGPHGFVTARAAHAVPCRASCTTSATRRGPRSRAPRPRVRSRTRRTIARAPPSRARR